MSDRLPELLDAKAYVYVFRHAYAVKVGRTRSPEARRCDMERACGLPVEAVAVFPVKDWHRAQVVEAWAFHKLREHRTFGEWFSCSAEAAVEALGWAVESAPPSTPDVTATLLAYWDDKLDKFIGGTRALRDAAEGAKS